MLSVYFGFPWWAMILVGPLFGLVFGVIITIPAIRLEGFYYALLTVGINELCRELRRAVAPARRCQQRAATAPTRFVPAWMSERGGLVMGFYGAFIVLLLALTLYRLVNGQRLGRLLRAAPEKHEAFAEALGINYRLARIQVFLISSAALGGIGGFYATYYKGASPSLFGLDNLLLLLAMIVIGGIGTTEGAVLGTFIVVLFNQVFIGLGPLRLMIVGAIMLGTVLFLRGGLLGIPDQFRTWRAKRTSERRALSKGTGGEVMPEEATEIRDKQTIFMRRFDQWQRDELKGLITDDLDRGAPAHHGRAAQRRAGAGAGIFPAGRRRGQIRGPGGQAVRGIPASSRFPAVAACRRARWTTVSTPPPTRRCTPCSSSASRTSWNPDECGGRRSARSPGGPASPYFGS